MRRRNRQNSTIEKNGSDRMHRNNNTPEANDIIGNSSVQSNSFDHVQEKYSSTRSSRCRSVDVSPIVVIDVDIDESSSSTSCSELSGTSLQFVSPAKCPSRKRRRINDTVDLSEDESMLSTVSTVSLATVECVDKLQISEDARHGFDDPVLKHPQNNPNKNGETDKSSDCSSTILDQAVDLTTSRDVRSPSTCQTFSTSCDSQPPTTLSDGQSSTIFSDSQQCVHSETEDKETQQLSTIHTPTNLSTAANTVCEPVNLSHEAVDLTCQSPIPIILGCNTENPVNVSSCGDMKNRERSKSAVSPTPGMYAQNGIGKSQSGVHQETLIPIQVDAEPVNIVDVNNNKDPEQEADQLELVKNVYGKHSSNKQSSTSFKGLLKDICSDSGTNDTDEFSSSAELNVYKQSYYGEPQNLTASSKQDFVEYSPFNEQSVNQYPQIQTFPDKTNTYTPQIQSNNQQSQHYNQGSQSYQQQQLMTEENCQMTNFMQYSQYGQQYNQQIDDQLAAEQLASELVQNFAGSNSHRISDILKRNGGQNYIHGGFERGNEMVYNQIPGNQSVIQDVGNQSVIQDVHLLNTPQQVSVTYNDVHLHGGRWSSKKTVADMHTQNAPESPFPPGSLEAERVALLCKDGDSSFYSDDSESACNLTRCTPDLSRKPFMNLKQFPHATNIQQQQQQQQQAELPGYLGYGNIRTGRSPPSNNKRNQYMQPLNEITKMTFTPREMMETHLSQNYQYPKKEVIGHQMSEMDYSSIYPSRDFIDRTANEAFVQKDHKRKRSDSCTSMKRPRTSKYNTDDVPKVPPQMPIIDHMFQKYPPALRREESSGGKHKYFVVNPSEITNMSAKSLLTKYIDFLIVENEQVTEISKSTNPPVDIYVTEDMYFMDTLKFHVPFPSRKFVEWVANFYPRMNFSEMKFKGKYPMMPKEGDDLIVDQRPTQVILEDTFYYFQRIALNGTDSVPKGK